MKIVIPAAGQGVRLRPHTWTRPKVMLPVAGRPIIGHILADVAPLGASEVRLIVGYEGETLAAYAREAFPDLPIRIVWQAERHGLGHAVLQALDEGDEEPVLVVLGDTVFDVAYGDVVACPTHALGVRPVDDPHRFGIVELDATGGRIVRLVEKPEEPASDLALVGLYWVTRAERLRAALAGLVEGDRRTRGEYQLTDALQSMIDDGETFAPFRIGEWFDCGTSRTLLDTNRQLLDRRPVEMPGDLSGAAATIVPPVAIGPGCTIERAVVGPHVSLGRGAVVRDAVIRDSIVGDGATIEGAVLERSILGPRTRVQGRPRIFNLGDDSEVEA